MSIYIYIYMYTFSVALIRPIINPDGFGFAGIAGSNT